MAQVLVGDCGVRTVLCRYLPFESAAAHLLFQPISRRDGHGSVLITSNRAVGDWGTVPGDRVVATAIPAPAPAEASRQRRCMGS